MTNEEKHLCAARELKLRERVYPRMIEKKTMSVKKAAFEIECMKLISDDYRRLAEKERLI